MAPIRAPPKSAIFLDRDGTINVEIEYLHEPEKFRFEQYVLESLDRFIKVGYQLFVVTNQGAIGRGMYSLTDMERTHNFMIAELKKQNLHLDGIYYCPHPKAQKCDCRKPAPGMILRAMQEHKINPEHSWMIGDKLSDIEAGNAAGLQSILVLTGYGRQEQNKLENLEKCAREPMKPAFIAENLKIAADFILNQLKN
jgi:D,D-heptose 1,7-bisphosphate phosphatase